MTKKQKITEMLNNGKIIFEKHTKYFNDYTNRWLNSNLYHVRYENEVWCIDTVTGAKGGYISGDAFVMENYNR